MTKELQRLVSEGILEPVQFSEWASPIVAVLKEDRKSVRLCGDFKQTINPVFKLDRYPLPRSRIYLLHFQEASHSQS